MPTTARKGDFMDRKIINVSKKRQITIPIKFYEHLGLKSEVECSIENNAIVIRPLTKDTGEFSVEILRDLVSQGYSGDELVKMFESQSKDIKSALNNILEEADEIIAGEKTSASFDDIFNSDN